MTEKNNSRVKQGMKNLSRNKGLTEGTDDLIKSRTDSFIDSFTQQEPASYSALSEGVK